MVDRESSKRFMRSVDESLLFFFSSRRRHTRSLCDWSSDVCSSDLYCPLDEIDGVERAVDRAMSPEEEAGKRHHLAAAIGRERRDDQGHGQVQENPEPPTPGDEKKERNERGGRPEKYCAEPGRTQPPAKLPEK